MTLHEAIKLILQEQGKPMAAGDIAEMINERELYTRKDGLPVSEAQINARVENHQDTLGSEFGKIRLAADDLVTQSVFKYQQKITNAHYLNEDNADGLSRKAFIDSLKEILNEDDQDTNVNVVRESVSPYGNVAYMGLAKLETAYKLFNWYLLQNSDVNLVISDKLALFLSELKWFRKGAHRISAVSNYSQHYLLKIASENQESSFDMVNLKEAHAAMDYDLSQITNHYVKEMLVKYSVNPSADINAKISTGIFIPPFGNNKAAMTEFYAYLSRCIENPKWDRAIVLVASSFLFSGAKDVKLLRENIAKSGYLDSVVQLPSNMLDKTGIKTNLLLLNFTEKREDIFFFDASSDTEYSSPDVLNEKKVIRNTSIFTQKSDVKQYNFDLSPSRYVFEPDTGQLEPGYSLLSVAKLIVSQKRGVSIKKGLYAGGEHKIIRTREIDGDSYYFSPDSSSLGIDPDVLGSKSKYLIKAGVVLSALNKKLSAKIISGNESYLPGQGVFWVSLNEKIILKEYFIQQLREKYVSEQVDKFSKTAAISRLSLKDFLQFQIKVPSLEKQKDLMLLEMQDIKSKKEAPNVSEKEVDFMSTLEHSLKQPTSGLGNDLNTLRNFLSNKSNSGDSLDLNESVVQLYNSDTPEQVGMYTLSSTLKRMARAVTDINYILQQARSITIVGAKPTLDIVKMNRFVKNLISENSEIDFRVKGNAEIMADKKQLRILFNNLIQNAKHHGFKENTLNPTIWIEIKPKDELSIEVSVRNNGKPLPPEFTIEDFLAKGNQSKQDVGSGFGGYLIGQILKNHNGKIELVKNANFGMLPHNVEFLITLLK